MKYYRGGFEVMIKPDATPVTQADREAERVIVEILGRAFPEHGVLGEEFGGEGSSETRWIIDPIDGTKNFVRRVPLGATPPSSTASAFTSPARRACPALFSCTPGSARSATPDDGTSSCAWSTRPSGSGASATIRVTAWWPRARPRSTPSWT